MPLFDHRCPQCGSTLEEFCHKREPDPIVCEPCGVPMTRLLSAGMKYRIDNASFFEPFTTTEILPGGEPVLVKSREHMNALCRENGLTSKATPAKIK